MILLLAACETEDISFSREIKPLLNEKCLPCHGGIRQRGALSLLTRDQATAVNSKSGLRAIVPGYPGRSELIRRVTAKGDEERMPKDDHALGAEEIDLLHRWIREGASWDKHWAYEPLAKSDMVIQSAWGIGSIDAFVYDQMSDAGLQPNPRADPYTLLRRLSLDLTGLPPSPSLVDKFSDRHILSYSEVVDSLLSSPHFGEHWSSFWLDLARYADSKGYEKDPSRDMWRYRDWVINAFNTDIPFDDFSRAQLAGDLLNTPNHADLVATAFHRNTMTNTEGGTDDEEFRVAAVMDRLNTTFEVWQSTTIACAQCHDHPYDPISQEEYYESLSLFNNTMDADLSAEFPVMEFYSRETKGEMSDLLDFLLEADRASKLKNQATLGSSPMFREALFPDLYVLDCDDFLHVQIYSNGIATNWSNNVNDGRDRKYYFTFRDIDMEGLEGISFTYSTAGDDGALQVTLDSIRGARVLDLSFPRTKSTSGQEWIGDNEWREVEAKTAQFSGRHDLVFEIINTTGKVPEGIILLKKLRLHYEGEVADHPETTKWKDSLLTLRYQADKLPVIREKGEVLRRTNRVFSKGNYQAPLDTVQPDVPAYLGETIGVSTRLDLANWLFSEGNPLTPRVMVNRFWERLFGHGLVSTLEEFGSQGAAPVNRNLLDYLASQWKNVHDWSVKELLREIVLSETYCQSSDMGNQKLERDPYNTLFSRGPRFRLSAEQIRDQALFVSGLLYDTIGGKSVMPLQPEGIWRTVYNNSNWKTSKGKMKYRRALYTYWKRTSPYPSLEIFDAPSRQVCKSQRIRTNTPNQALVLLNDPVYIEAANSLSERMIRHSSLARDQIIHGFRLALCRNPGESTLRILEDLYSTAQEEEYHTATMTADGNGVGLNNAMAVVAHAILNLDEFITKG